MQCDTEKLIRDSLSIADSIAELLELAAPKAAHYLVKGTTQRDLGDQLAQCIDARREEFPDHPAFDFVVLIGHSEPRGIRLASDGDVRWADLGPWFEPLAPARILLVACEAGRLEPVRGLFDCVPSLREIYSTPGKASLVQEQVAFWLTMVLMHSWNSQKDLIGIGLVLTAAFFDEPVFRWKRDKKSVELLHWVDLLAVAIPILKKAGLWRSRRT